MIILPVIVATPSVFIRNGLVNFLRSMGIEGPIREVSSPDKILPVVRKTPHVVLFISYSWFLAHIDKLSDKPMGKSTNKVVVLSDGTESCPPAMGADEVIAFDDSEKSLMRKLRRVFALKDIPERQLAVSDEISEREKEVLRLVALGYTNTEIGRILFISTHTVITHRKNLSAKLGIKTIAGLTIYAFINRIVTAGEIKANDQFGND